MRFLHGQRRRALRRNLEALVFTLVIGGCAALLAVHALHDTRHDSDRPHRDRELPEATESTALTLHLSLAGMV